MEDADAPQAFPVFGLCYVGKVLQDHTICSARFVGIRKRLGQNRTSCSALGTYYSVHSGGEPRRLREAVEEAVVALALSMVEVQVMDTEKRVLTTFVLYSGGLRYLGECKADPAHVLCGCGVGDGERVVSTAGGDWEGDVVPLFIFVPSYKQDERDAFWRFRLCGTSVVAAGCFRVPGGLSMSTVEGMLRNIRRKCKQMTTEIAVLLEGANGMVWRVCPFRGHAVTDLRAGVF